MLRATRAMAVVMLAMGFAAVNVAPAGANTPPTVKAYGVVVAVNGSSADGACGTAGATGTFRVLSRNTSRTTVHVNSHTQFTARNISAPTFANVCVDAMVGAAGHVR